MNDLTTAAPGKITARQRKAIPLILAAKSFEKGLESAGITRMTWWRWRGEPTFAAALATAQNVAFVEALDRLRGATLRAADKAAELLDHEDPRVALQAISAILNNALRVDHSISTWKEINDLKRKLGK